MILMVKKIRSLRIRSDETCWRCFIEQETNKNIEKGIILAPTSDLFFLANKKMN